MHNTNDIEQCIKDCWWYTKKQKQLLLLIYKHNKLEAKPLGIRTIAKELNTKPNLISKRLKRLESYEVIKIGKEYTNRQARTIQLDTSEILDI